jgi:hypothetical protein
MLVTLLGMVMLAKLVLINSEASMLVKSTLFGRVALARSVQ